MPAAEPKTVRTKGVRGIMLGRRPARKRHAGSDSNVVRTSDAGFTLLELLVVLVILALLAGLVGPQLFGRVDSAKVKTAETQVRMLRGALQTFRLDIGRYPTNEEGLAALVRPAAKTHGTRPIDTIILPTTCTDSRSIRWARTRRKAERERTRTLAILEPRSGRPEGSRLLGVAIC